MVADPRLNEHNIRTLFLCNVKIDNAQMAADIAGNDVLKSTPPHRMLVITSALALCNSKIKVKNTALSGDVTFKVQATCPSSIDCIGINETIFGKLSYGVSSALATVAYYVKLVSGVETDIKVASCAASNIKVGCEAVCKTDCKSIDKNNKIKVHLEYTTTERKDNNVKSDYSYNV